MRSKTKLLNQELAELTSKSFKLGKFKHTSISLAQLIFPNVSEGNKAITIAVVRRDKNVNCENAILPHVLVIYAYQ